jgi:hypothetical protein
MKRNITEVACGFLLIAAGAAGWHYWQIEGCLAGLVGFVGLCLILDAFDAFTPTR